MRKKTFFKAFNTHKITFINVMMFLSFLFILLFTSKNLVSASSSSPLINSLMYKKDNVYYTTSRNSSNVIEFMFDDKDSYDFICFDDGIECVKANEATDSSDHSKIYLKFTNPSNNFNDIKFIELEKETYKELVIKDKENNSLTYSINYGLDEYMDADIVIKVDDDGPILTNKNIISNFSDSVVIMLENDPTYYIKSSFNLDYNGLYTDIGSGLDYICVTSEVGECKLKYDVSVIEPHVPKDLVRYVYAYDKVGNVSEFRYEFVNVSDGVRFNVSSDVVTPVKGSLIVSINLVDRYEDIATLKVYNSANQEITTSYLDNKYTFSVSENGVYRIVSNSIYGVAKEKEVTINNIDNSEVIDDNSILEANLNNTYSKGNRVYISKNSSINFIAPIITSLSEYIYVEKCYRVNDSSYMCDPAFHRINKVEYLNRNIIASEYDTSSATLFELNNGDTLTYKLRFIALNGSEKELIRSFVYVDSRNYSIESSIVTNEEGNKYGENRYKDAIISLVIDRDYNVDVNFTSLDLLDSEGNSYRLTSFNGKWSYTFEVDNRYLINKIKLVDEMNNTYLYNINYEFIIDNVVNDEDIIVSNNGDNISEVDDKGYLYYSSIKDRDNNLVFTVEKVSNGVSYDLKNGGGNSVTLPDTTLEYFIDITYIDDANNFKIISVNIINYNYIASAYIELELVVSQLPNEISVKYELKVSEYNIINYSSYTYSVKSNGASLETFVVLKENIKYIDISNIYDNYDVLLVEFNYLVNDTNLVVSKSIDITNKYKKPSLSFTYSISGGNDLNGISLKENGYVTYSVNSEYSSYIYAIALSKEYGVDDNIFMISIDDLIRVYNIGDKYLVAKALLDETNNTFRVSSFLGCDDYYVYFLAVSDYGSYKFYSSISSSRITYDDSAPIMNLYRTNNASILNKEYINKATLISYKGSYGISFVDDTSISFSSNNISYSDNITSVYPNVSCSDVSYHSEIINLCLIENNDIEKEYKIYAKDLVGNISYYNFIIDNKNPDIELTDTSVFAHIINSNGVFGYEYISNTLTYNTLEANFTISDLTLTRIEFKVRSKNSSYSFRIRVVDNDIVYDGIDICRIEQEYIYINQDGTCKDNGHLVIEGDKYKISIGDVIELVWVNSNELINEEDVTNIEIRCFDKYGQSYKTYSFDFSKPIISTVSEIVDTSITYSYLSSSKKRFLFTKYISNRNIYMLHACLNASSSSCDNPYLELEYDGNSVKDRLIDIIKDIILVDGNNNLTGMKIYAYHSNNTFTLLANSIDGYDVSEYTEYVKDFHKITDRINYLGLSIKDSVNNESLYYVIGFKVVDSIKPIVSVNNLNEKVNINTNTNRANTSFNISVSDASLEYDYSFSLLFEGVNLANLEANNYSDTNIFSNSYLSFNVSSNLININVLYAGTYEVILNVSDKYNVSYCRASFTVIDTSAPSFSESELITTHTINVNGKLNNEGKYYLNLYLLAIKDGLEIYEVNEKDNRYSLYQRAQGRISYTYKAPMKDLDFKNAMVTSNNIILKEIGDYSITYSYCNLNNKCANLNFLITIIDDISPIIKINNSEEDYSYTTNFVYDFDINAHLNTLNITSFDNYTKDMPVSLTKIETYNYKDENFNNQGREKLIRYYIATYSVSDSSGNSDSIKAYVYLEDNEKPIMVIENDRFAIGNTLYSNTGNVLLEKLPYGRDNSGLDIEVIYELIQNNRVIVRNSYVGDKIELDLDDGEYTLRFKAIDIVGNESDWYSYKYLVNSKGLKVDFYLIKEYISNFMMCNVGINCISINDKKIIVSKDYVGVFINILSNDIVNNTLFVLNNNQYEVKPYNNIIYDTGVYKLVAKDAFDNEVVYEFYIYKDVVSEEKLTFSVEGRDPIEYRDMFIANYNMSSGELVYDSNIFSKIKTSDAVYIIGNSNNNYLVSEKINGDLFLNVNSNYKISETIKQSTINIDGLNYVIVLLVENGNENPLPPVNNNESQESIDIGKIFTIFILVLTAGLTILIIRLKKRVKAA